MAALTGNSVGTSYLGLLKTTDNGVLGQQTPSVITDGAGNATPLSIAQFKVILEKDNQRIDVNDTQTSIEGDTVIIKDATATNLLQTTATSIALGNNTNNLAFDATNGAFAGAIDFAGATVTGLPPAGGVGTGTGVNSMATLLTNLPAVASGSSSLALGRNAKATNDSAISIGNYAGYTGNSGSKAIAIGSENSAVGSTTISMGWLSNANVTAGIAIGRQANSRAENCITIGRNSLVDDAVRVDTVCVGANTKAAQYSTALGAGAFAVGDYCVSIGDANTYDTGAIAIGDQAQSFTKGAVALGRNITAIAWQDSTTVNQLALANVANLNFADDTAAATGGVPVGGVYHNAGAMRIRIA